jgi:hypothetical protein
MFVIPPITFLFAFIFLIVRLPETEGTTLTRRRILCAIFCVILGLASFALAADMVQRI